MSLFEVSLFLMGLALTTGQPSTRDQKSEFERQVAEAEYVIVGMPTSTQIRSIKGIGEVIVTTVRIDHVLLGELNQKSIAVVVSAPISHYDVDCCRPGCRYAFLLEESEGYFYATRFGRGVHAVDKASRCFAPL